MFENLFPLLFYSLVWNKISMLYGKSFILYGITVGIRLGACGNHHFCFGLIHGEC